MSEREEGKKGALPESIEAMASQEETPAESETTLTETQPQASESQPQAEESQTQAEESQTQLDEREQRWQQIQQQLEKLTKELSSLKRKVNSNSLPSASSRPASPAEVETRSLSISGPPATEAVPKRRLQRAARARKKLRRPKRRNVKRQSKPPLS